MTDELASVSRIGKLPSRITVPCPSCGGDGWQDSGFAFGSNVSFGRVCTHCRGAKFVWRNVSPKVIA